MRIADVIDAEPEEREAQCHYSPPFARDGVEWITIEVLKTTPSGALVRWTAKVGGVVAECLEGDTIEVLNQAMIGELQISIIAPVEE